jgi:hypothetical protein
MMRRWAAVRTVRMHAWRWTAMGMVVVMRGTVRSVTGPLSMMGVRSRMRSVAVIVWTAVVRAVVAFVVVPSPVSIEAGKLDAHRAPYGLGLFRRHAPFAEFVGLVFLGVRHAQRAE